MPTDIRSFNAPGGLLSAPSVRIATITLLLATAMACGDDDGDPPTTDAGIVLGQAFGVACTANDECEARACIEVAQDRGVCTGGCDPDDETTCPMAPNWACMTQDGLGGPVCTCQSDDTIEICDDGLDNDCDGLVDNCLLCGGQLVGADNPNHCGRCGRSCGLGAKCRQEQCVCDEDVEFCVLDPDVAQCERDRDCDDEIPCTEDVCSDGRCLNTVVPARCDAGEVCDLRREGCVPGEPCGRDRDCDDEDPCTTREICDPATKVCLWTPLDGDSDGQPPRVCGGQDCNDADPFVFTGAMEICDGVDNSCDGVVDGALPSDACPAMESCVAGACTCNDDLVKCSGTCVDVMTDVLNCGECFRPCPAGALCDDGICACPEGWRECRGICVDPSADPRHCGGCGAACGAGERCEEGTCADVDECAEDIFECPGEHIGCEDRPGGYACVCDPGYGWNGEECVDLDECASPMTNDCLVGACVNTDGGFDCECPDGYVGDGKTCDDADECESQDCGPNGTCRNTIGGFTCDCDPGYRFDAVDSCEVANACQAGILAPDERWCGGACRTVATDVNHCGDCGVSCGSGGTCSDGNCVCDGSLSFCPQAGCVNLQSDRNHCDACGAACPTGAGCVSGQCICPVDQIACNDICVSLGTTANCLSCGDGCATGASCQASGCACPGGAPDICDGLCVNRQTSTQHCGTCGNACAMGASCTGGACACPSGEQVCSNECANLATSERYCGDCNTSCDVLCDAASCRVVVQIATSTQTTCTLMDDGAVFCWGSNTLGQRGGSPFSVVQPNKVVLPAPATALASGYEHFCAVTAAEELYCWGYNNVMQANPGATGNQTAPVRVLQSVTDAAVGRLHTCVSRKSGQVSCVGRDTNGVKGDGATMSADGTWVDAVGLTDVDKLAAGEAHMCALKGGEVFCWGDNLYGQLGLGTSGTQAHRLEPTKVSGLSGVTDLAAGQHHTCAIAAGTVKCWGRNSQRQTGSASPDTVVFPTDTAVTTATSVEAGATHTCAELTSGDLVCWGAGSLGQRGDGLTGGASATPATVINGAGLSSLSLGGTYSCALDSAGAVFCWGGSNNYANGMSSNLTTPREVTLWSNVP